MPYQEYSERLKTFNLQSLETRRLITDLTMVFKIVRNKTTINPSTMFNFSKRVSRRHNFQLRSKYLSPKKLNSFSNRIQHTWNVLDRETVNAINPNIFKRKLIGNLKTLKANNRLQNLVFPL